VDRRFLLYRIGHGVDLSGPVANPALSVHVIGGYGLLSWLGAAACVSTGRAPAAPFFGSRVVLAAAAVPLIAALTPPRAEMFTAVFFAAYVSILWHYHRSGKGPLWLLPVLMCLWVNLHLGFIAGLAMCGAFVLLELEDALAPARKADAWLRLKEAVPWLIATLAATLVNPWGWRIYAAIERQAASFKPIVCGFGNGKDCGLRPPRFREHSHGALRRAPCFG